MDPKSYAGKPPSFEALTAEMGSKLSEWVHKDMERAKKAREERKKRKNPGAGADKPAEPPGK